MTVSGLLVAGCGGGAGAGGEESISARAVAAVALDHLPEDTSSRQATYVDRTDAEGLVGADLRYGASPGDDGDLVRVSVTPGETVEGCAPRTSQHCAELGGGDLLEWDVAGAEEPGAMQVVTERDGATVTALYAGTAITRDPRRMDDLPLAVDALRAVVDDVRLAPTASAATLAAGEDLGGWDDSGDREEGELDEVAQTSAGLVGTFLLGSGGRWTYEGPSPVADDLGDGAVGGRVRGFVSGPIGPGVLDVAAVPQMPAWAEPDTCREGWRCWTREETRVVWRPARGDDPGESWLLQPSELGGVAALHTRGRPIPDAERQIRYYSGYVMWARSLTDPVEPQAIGTTTDRQGLEQAEALAAEHEAG